MGTKEEKKAGTQAKKVEDYTLADNDGKTVRLSGLFRYQRYLIVLHNMGKTCPSCALWGDEFDGMLRHIEKVSAFCVIGPDDPDTQKTYLKERNWKAKLYSAKGSAFIKDMGLEDEDGDAEPGISIFQKGSDGVITVLDQVNVPNDQRISSVLEVLNMIPDAEMSKIAWNRP